jgi:uncharacterized protein YbjT (DUF2867 family)
MNLLVFNVRMTFVLTYGSTGSQGAPVAHKLLDAGHRVRCVVRHPEPAAALQARGAEVVVGDLTDPASLERASAGVEAVYLMIPVSAPGNPFDMASNALNAARNAGAKLVVFTTGGHPPATPTGIPMFDGRIQMETLIASAGIPSIILRPGVYMENFLGPWCLPSVEHQSIVAYPHRRDMPASWIASDDLGAFAVAAIERPHLAGNAYTLGGPEALDGDAIAAAFTAGLGRTIGYQPISGAEFGAAMTQFMGPEMGGALGAAYTYQESQPNDSMTVSMVGVLTDLPIQQTRLQDWVRLHQDTFTAN